MPAPQPFAARKSLRPAAARTESTYHRGRNVAIRTQFFNFWSQIQLARLVMWRKINIWSKIIITLFQKLLTRRPNLIITNTPGYVPAAAIADSCGPQKAAAQAYRVRYYKTLKIVKISEISEKNIFLIRFIFNFKPLFCVD